MPQDLLHELFSLGPAAGWLDRQGLWSLGMSICSVVAAPTPLVGTAGRSE